MSRLVALFTDPSLAGPDAMRWVDATVRAHNLGGAAVLLSDITGADDRALDAVWTCAPRRVVTYHTSGQRSEMVQTASGSYDITWSSWVGRSADLAMVRACAGAKRAGWDVCAVLLVDPRSRDHDLDPVLDALAAAAVRGDACRFGPDVDADDDAPGPLAESLLT